MSFKDIDTEEFKAQRNNTLTNSEDNKVYATHTTKVLEEDHARLKTFAFQDKKKMFEVAHDALIMYEMFQKEGAKLGLSTTKAAALAIELLKNNK
ncbi:MULTISPECIES: hypothetical protein [Bacillus cereus group]|uniref:Uncharacterized protein n=1 Tax=Bacillus thuringiensis serovar toumanoffi TaxID=180862 RepID=A0ABD5I9K5_BACTU|nr:MULTISPECIES: hypothetical protein [Bacillus cereus group]AMR88314.1 hypothetical protein A3L20_30360 [Bacillus thuringiensis]MBG9637485.1 hypothetical protein [Bacillus thuringiensis]MBG9670446.1 hypothetical protein [Bacillus thuringiensis]MCR6784320.1 hypothetical protein [Bacillus thuringiensis]MCR6863146.1 hypothetical protein [Bacillus thuringiensis]